MTKDKFNPIQNKLKELNELHEYLANNVIWQNQEGQEDHFDKLPKAEQIALIGIYNNLKQTISSIKQFEHWFMN